MFPSHFLEDVAGFPCFSLLVAAGEASMICRSCSKATLSFMKSPWPEETFLFFNVQTDGLSLLFAFYQAVRVFRYPVSLSHFDI